LIRPPHANGQCQTGMLKNGTSTRFINA
jgi:hypothetical protein